MQTLDDYANESAETVDSSATSTDSEAIPVRPKFQIPEWLKVKASREPLESFVDHPLNFDRDIDLARAVRGITAMFSAFDYAVVDVIFGFFKYFRKKKSPVEINMQPPGQSV